MRTTRRLATTAALAALVGLPLASGPASAHSHEGGHELTGQLTQLNDSGASGTAWAQVDGDQVHIKVDTKGLLEGSPHAQHIHIGGEGVCPTDDMAGEDGILSTVEGAPAYGGVKVSLTKEPGKTDAGAALDVANFPTGATNTYERTITVDDALAQQIANGDGVVVVHGIDANGSGTYDGDAKSELDDSLPLEATAPAACGELNVAQMAMPHGGVETGGTSTAGFEYAGALALGGLALGLGGVGFAANRLRTNR